MFNLTEMLAAIRAQFTPTDTPVHDPITNRLVGYITNDSHRARHLIDVNPADRRQVLGDMIRVQEHESVESFRDAVNAFGGGLGPIFITTICSGAKLIAKTTDGRGSFVMMGLESSAEARLWLDVGHTPLTQAGLYDRLVLTSDPSLATLRTTVETLAAASSVTVEESVGGLKAAQLKATWGTNGKGAAKMPEMIEVRIQPWAGVDVSSVFLWRLKCEPKSKEDPSPIFRLTSFDREARVAGAVEQFAAQMRAELPAFPVYIGTHETTCFEPEPVR